MAQTKRKNRKKTGRRKIKNIISIIIGIIIVIGGYLTIDKIADDKNTVYEIPDGTAQFHFIDVGQGDSELIMVGDKAVLIDTGDRGGKNALVEYLSKHNITEIEYFIITHPDADHYASAAYVMENYTVKNVIMSHAVKTGTMYETFVETLEKHEEINIINAHENLEKNYYVDDLELKILAPIGEKYSSTNDYSVVIMARYGNTKVLLTGDAEEKSETEMVAQYSSSQLKCDVLKVGHHGSSTSTSDDFLLKANPKFAVISCGKDNKFNHPHKETVEKLMAIGGIIIYRTDTMGSIVLETDGQTITKK